MTHNYTRITKKIFILTIVCIVFSTILAPNLYASATSQVTDTELKEALCEILDFMQGQFGKALSTIAIIGLAVMAIFGRAQMTHVLTITLGISIVFSAQDIYFQLNGDTDHDNSTEDPCQKSS